jgi:hypothetical protein
MHSIKAKRSTSKLRPQLSESTKKKRQTFAERHIADGVKWMRTIFSDEKKFSLTGPDSYRAEWTLPDSPPQIVEQSRFRNESVMVWAAIGYNYKSPIHIFDSTVDAQVYIEMLSIHFFPDVIEKLGPDFFFIQDNAPPPRATDTQMFLLHKGCTVLEWPPYSPDLNVIEHCWNLLSRRVFEERASYDTVAQLSDAILTGWDSISLEEINGLVLSMVDRLRETIKRDGGHTHY